MYYFSTISNGEYAESMYAHFGKERVDAELMEFLRNEFIPRFGGGIGLTRLLKALKKYGLMDAIMKKYNNNVKKN